MDSISLSDQDEECYLFDNFELVFENDVTYILSDNGFFLIDKIDDIRPYHDHYIIVDDQDRQEITAEEFARISSLFKEKENGSASESL